MTPPIRRATVPELARTFGPDRGDRLTMAAGYFYRTVAIAATLLASCVDAASEHAA
jgi:hypothetical protein